MTTVLVPKCIATQAHQKEKMWYAAPAFSVHNPHAWDTRPCTGVWTESVDNEALG